VVSEKKDASDMTPLYTVILYISYKKNLENKYIIIETNIKVYLNENILFFYCLIDLMQLHTVKRSTVRWKMKTLTSHF